MNKKIVLAAIVSAALMGCQSTSDGSTTNTATNTGGSAYSSIANAALLAAAQSWGQQNESTSVLAQAVQQNTNVTSEQAIGGVGSLLALAQNSLGQTQNNELAGLIPGYDMLQQTGLTSMIANSEMVKSSFSALGMDPSLVSTFAPIILQALQSQGASTGLLSSLGSIWQ